MVDRLKEIAARRGKSVAEFAIARVPDNPAVNVARRLPRRTAAPATAARYGRRSGVNPEVTVGAMRLTSLRS